MYNTPRSLDFSVEGTQAVGNKQLNWLNISHIEARQIFSVRASSPLGKPFPPTTKKEAEELVVSLAWLKDCKKQKACI